MGPNDLPMDVWKCMGKSGMKYFKDLFSRITEERIPDEWRKLMLIPVFKNTENILSCGNYRSIKLMTQPMKMQERVVEIWLEELTDA